MEARGHSGGIWVLKKNGSNIVNVVHDVFVDTITIKLLFKTSSWYVTGIYDSLVYTSHLDMWLYLIGRRNFVDGHWILKGDFNDIIHLSE